MPKRATKGAAGYDFEAAEDVTIPSIFDLSYTLQEVMYEADPMVAIFDKAGWMSDIREKLDKLGINLETIFKPILVPTGVKAYMQDDEYLAMFNRSGNPMKQGLILTNGVGVVDSDYYSNVSNDGNIMFQFINLSNDEVTIKKGDRIGQGIFQKFMLADDDIAGGERTGGHGSTGTA